MVLSAVARHAHGRRSEQMVGGYWRWKRRVESKRAFLARLFPFSAMVLCFLLGTLYLPSTNSRAPASIPVIIDSPFFILAGSDGPCIHPSSIGQRKEETVPFESQSPDSNDKYLRTRHPRGTPV